MNISKLRLQQIVLEEYMKEEGIMDEALSQEKADEFIAWIKGTGPKPEWLDREYGPGSYKRGKQTPAYDSNVDRSAETMPFPSDDMPQYDDDRDEEGAYDTESEAPESIAATPAAQDPEQAILGIVSAMQPDEIVDLFNNIIGQVAPEYFQEPEPNPIGFREDLKTKVYDKLLEMAGIPYNRDDEYDEERIEPGMAEKEAMEDLAEKFGVEVEFSTTKKGEPVAIVTFEDGEQIVYRDEEEMYQDLAKRYEMSEGIAALKNV